MDTTKKIEKIRLKDIGLSEEIKSNSKLFKAGSIDNFKYPVYTSKIQYKEFKVIIINHVLSKDTENFFYRKSKYGWWIFCAQKDEMDDIDKKLLITASSEYGMYREGDHSLCNDNMQGGEYFYNLHPNEMINIVKKSIDKFYEDKEKLISTDKTTAKEGIV